MSQQNKFHCDICTSDCTNRVRISCHECENYDLCVNCFAQGLYSGKHRPYHPYRVIETHTYPILCNDWGADEELSLVKGCQTFGIGSWQDIADFVGSRTKEEIKDHYETYYLNSNYYPLPDITKDEIKISQNDFMDERRKRVERFAKLPIPQLRKPFSSVPSCHDIQGFMPARMDFEHEFEDDAENSIKEMTFSAEDSKLNVELKLAVLDIYSQRLTTRQEKKRLIFRNELVEYKKHVAIDKKRSKEVKDLLNRLKAFARAMTPDDFKVFGNDLGEELDLRTRIDQLQEWRRNGITTMEAGAKYEKDKQQKQITLERYGNDLTGGTGTRQSHQRAASMAAQLSISDTTNSDSFNKNANVKKEDKSDGLDFVNDKEQTVNNIPAKKLIVTTDFNHSSDFQLLSKREQTICIQLKIAPKTYIALKEFIFRELLNKGGLITSSDFSKLVGLDTLKAIRLYDFFCSQGWVESLK
ncbi:hypothetical protein QEN19_001083 [Hanseniaspora menglaensis]